MTQATDCNVGEDDCGFYGNESDLCGICYTSELCQEQCVNFSCGHTFHKDCVIQMIEHKSSTLKITFGYLDCPSCKKQISLKGYEEGLTELLKKSAEYKQRIQKMAIQKAIENGLDKEGRVVTEGDYYYSKLDEYAMKNCTFYECHKC